PYAVLSHCRAINRYRAGRVTDAVADAESAVAGYVHGWHWGLPGSHAYLCQAYLERGELERAAAALELPEGEEAWSDSILWMLYLEARGRLALERRAPEAALAEFRRAGELAESMQLENPAVLPWRARAAEAMRALGRDAEARRLADEDLRRARAFGTPWGLGVCLRARGLVEGGTDAVDWLRQAVEALEQGPNRLERSRALVDLGAALRRAGRKREARDTLRHGMNLARDCEALALVRRAEEELRASGARLVQRELSGVEGLTPSERRVAHMAASGMSNREIAAALFVTLRTVETHLTHSYRKLEVDSRAELRKRLSPEARSNLVVRPR
ncbi:MAG: helix-turn-helix transcriptional regulator, partial [Thermoleophilaceae bacterium]